MKRKRKVLVLADAPMVATGFAQVTRNLLKELYDSGGYEIDMIGINYFGHYDRKEFEKKYYYINSIMPAMRVGTNDIFGRELALKVLSGQDISFKPPWDIFFTIQDHFVLDAKSKNTKTKFSDTVKKIQKVMFDAKEEELRKKHFLWISYWPVDGELKKHWVSDTIAKSDYPVAYCEYGRDQILSKSDKKDKLYDRLKVIRHGTNTKDFFPFSEKERKKLRKKYFSKFIKDDTHLLLSINRNQPRKDLARLLLVYKEFKKKVPNSFLYLHCNPLDTGGNIYDMVKALGLENTDIGYPKYFNEQTGISIELVNKLYACADAVVTTTLGEGWGLAITEAMATKTPIYAPNITSVPEIFNTREVFDPDKARGIPFKSGNTVNNWTCLGRDDNEIIRPLTDVNDAVSKLIWGYQNPNRVNKIVERAYKWASKLTWKSENNKWLAVFEEACQVNDRIRNKGKVKAILDDGQGNKYAAFKGDKPQKLGRNDKCPMCKEKGVDIKVKKCEHRDIFV